MVIAFGGALSLSRVLWKSAYSRFNMKPKSIPKQARNRSRSCFFGFRCFGNHSCCFHLYHFPFIFLSYLYSFLFIFLSDSFHVHLPFICMHVPFILHLFPFISLLSYGNGFLAWPGDRVQLKWLSLRLSLNNTCNI